MSIPFLAASYGKWSTTWSTPGIGVVWSTAYLDEAERCATVVLLNEGKSLYDGPPKELTARVTGDVPGPGARATSAEGAGHGAQLPDVLDGVIQGSSVRLVIARGPKRPDLPALGVARRTIEPTPPRFEDAFVDLLGGGPKAEVAASPAGNATRCSDEPGRRGPTD